MSMRAHRTHSAMLRSKGIKVEHQVAANGHADRKRPSRCVSVARCSDFEKGAVPGVCTKPRLMRGMGCLRARTTPGRRDEDVVAPRQRKISRSESMPESEADSVFDDALLLHVWTGCLARLVGIAG
jgi:hypothetical protein